MVIKDPMILLIKSRSVTPLALVNHGLLINVKFSLLKKHENKYLPVHDGI